MSIRYAPPIRGKTLIKPNNPAPTGMDFAYTIGGMSGLIAELQQLKKSLLDSVENKIKEIDSKIEEHTGKMAEATQQAVEATNQAIEVSNQAMGAVKDIHAQATEAIKNNVGPKGDPGIDANEETIYSRLAEKIPQALNKEELTKEILAKVPKVDEQKLLKKFLKALPENKASLKIIQEKFEIDPMSVIEKIMELAKQGKFKLKKENIDGLDQTMSAFQSQLGRGYLHGGGDTITAGSNITITTTSDGKKQISSTGGGGSNIETPTGTVDGSNTSFTVTHTPQYIISDSVVYFENHGYTLSGLNITMSVPPTDFIRSFYAA